MSSIATSQAGTILQTLGWANGYQTVNVVGTAQPVSDNGPAGGFAGIWNGLDILFFCDDLGHYFSLGSTFTDDYQASSLSLAPGTFGNNLSRLFTEAYSSGTPTDTTDRSVAFQLAVWELEYETLPGPYSLSNGTFTGIADAATIAEANALLAGLAGFAPQYQITQLTSTVPNSWGQPQSQNFIFATSTGAAPVPEPATLALLGMGLAGLGLSRRRKSK
jgi:PEP-CTERM motif-containing protein